MYLVLTFALLLTSLPFSICGVKTDFDCGYSLYKDFIPNAYPCTNNYMRSLGNMHSDNCGRLGGSYYYCDKLNKAYPMHCLVSL